MLLCKYPPIICASCTSAPPCQKNGWPLSIRNHSFGKAHSALSVFFSFHIRTVAELHVVHGVQEHHGTKSTMNIGMK
jgi:hypothetical protein